MVLLRNYEAEAVFFLPLLLNSSQTDSGNKVIYAQLPNIDGWMYLCVLWLHSCLWYFNEWMTSAPLVEMLYFPTRITPQRQLSNNNNTLSDSCLATFSFRPWIGMCIVLINTSPGCKILKYSLTLWLFIAYCHHSALRIQGTRVYWHLEPKGS